MALSLEYIKQRFPNVSFDGRSNIENKYEDTEFTRFKDGIELPVINALEHERLNEGYLFSKWGGARLDHSRCFYRLPEGSILLNSTIQRVLGNHASPHQLLSSYLQCPSGQIKNFLNACRATVSFDGDEIKILIIGSKMSEGGGLWHKYFALFLARQYSIVNIDFVDYSEREDTWTTTIDGSVINCQWIVGGVEIDKIPENRYDVIVDDAWLMSSGITLKKPPSMYFSIKGSTVIQDGFIPYLHPTETRKFGSDPNTFKPSCCCLLCREIGNIVSNFDDYVFLRSISSRLGHRSYCAGLVYSDLVSLSGLRRTLLQLPTVEVFKNKIIRLLTSLTEEMDIQVEGIDVSIGKRKPVFTPYSRFHLDKFIVREDNFDFLEGKRVAFAGVPSSILGSTKILLKDPEILFVNSFETWSNNQNYSKIFIDADPVEARVRFPHWKEGTEKVKNFKSFYKEGNMKEKRILPLKPFFISQNMIRKPSTLYPFIKTELKIIPFDKKVPFDYYLEAIFRENKDWDRCTMEMNGAIMNLIPFEKGKWRRSIVYDGSVYAHCTGALEGTDLYQGVAQDITEIEFYGINQHMLRDKSFQYWISSPKMIVQMEIPKDFWGKKKKENEWQCWWTSTGLTYCSFIPKLPKSLLQNKTSIRLSEWDIIDWNPSIIFSHLLEEEGLTEVNFKVKCEKCIFLNKRGNRGKCQKCRGIT